MIDDVTVGGNSQRHVQAGRFDVVDDVGFDSDALGRRPRLTLTRDRCLLDLVVKQVCQQAAVAQL